MTLSVTANGDNPFVPGISAQSYIPDQLIAGDLKLVTQNIVLGGGVALPRGSVIGQQTLGAAAAAVAAGAGGGGSNTGTGTCTAQAAGVKAKLGTYTIKFTGATAFTVVNPNGAELQPGTALGAYNDPEIAFTLTAGGTAFVAGDGFSINVPAGSGNYILSATAAIDGSQNPSAILVDYTDASQGNVAAGAYVMGEFNSNSLNLGTGWTVAALTPLLQPFSIFIKSAVSAADPSGE